MRTELESLSDQCLEEEDEARLRALLARANAAFRRAEPSLGARFSQAYFDCRGFHDAYMTRIDLGEALRIDLLLRDGRAVSLRFEGVSSLRIWGDLACGCYPPARGGARTLAQVLWMWFDGGLDCCVQLDGGRRVLVRAKACRLDG